MRIARGAYNPPKKTCRESQPPYILQSFAMEVSLCFVSLVLACRCFRLCCLSCTPASMFRLIMNFGVHIRLLSAANARALAHYRGRHACAYYLRVKPINQYSTSACDCHSSWKRVLDGAVDPRDPGGWYPGAFAGVRTAGLAI